MREVESVEREFGVFDQIPVGVCVVKSDFTVLFWNRCLEEWTGIPRSEMLGEDLGEQFPHIRTRKYLVRLQDIFTGGPPAVFSSQLHSQIIPPRMVGGSSRIQHTTVTPVRDRDGSGFYALFAIQDVTELTRSLQDYRVTHEKLLKELRERKRVERELRKSREELELRVLERTRDLVEINDRLEGEITERKLTEAVLRESREALRKTSESLEAVINASPLSIMTLDPAGNVTLWNPAAEKTFGWRQDEVVGRFNPILPGGGKGEFRALCERVLGGEDIRGVEVTGRKKDDSPIDIRISASPLHDADGRIRGIIGLCEDVTEHKRAVEALRRSETKHRALLDAIPDAIFRIRRDGTFLDFKAARDVSAAVPPGRLGDARMQDIMPENIAEKAMQHIEKALESREAQVFEYKIVEGGSGVRQYEARIVVSGDDEVLAIVRDVTEHRKLEEQLRHVQKMDAIGTLAGGISHEFNNIMTAIMGFGEIMQDEIAQDDPVRDYVDMVTASAKRAAKLTKGLLAYSRKQITHMEPCDINEILRTTRGYLSNIVGEHIELRVETAEKKLNAVIDKSMIEQVIVNLATNAVDAMQDGGTLNIRSELVRFDREYIDNQSRILPGRYVLLSVSDSGTGMDVETQFKIFEPFFTTKEVGKGTGLGLSIVYGIVRQHRGYIAVDSRPGEGTTFRIYLPTSNVEGVRAKARRPGRPTGGSETILLAEDDATVRDLLGRVLGKAGYRVIVAVDGQDAVEKFRENRDDVDILLFDVVMPTKSGKAAYDDIRAYKPGIKVVFISGYIADDIKARKILDEGHTLISKPVSPGELLKTIRQSLG